MDGRSGDRQKRVVYVRSSRIKITQKFEKKRRAIGITTSRWNSALFGVMSGRWNTKARLVIFVFAGDWMTRNNPPPRSGHDMRMPIQNSKTTTAKRRRQAMTAVMCLASQLHKKMRAIRGSR